MASAMGATLLTEEVHDLTYATDLIICGTEHSVRPRVLQQALERHIRVVSPLWIVSCFREQCYKNPYLFPYHMDNVKNTLKQSEDIDEDPFHINTLAIQKPLVEHDQISEFSASPSLPPSPPPKESKMPKPSKGVSAILNDKVFIASVKRRAPQLLIKGDEQRASTHFKTNKHPRKSTLFERNGLASMYVDKK
jgi:hypothetical protein